MRRLNKHISTFSTATTGKVQKIKEYYPWIWCGSWMAFKSFYAQDQAICANASDAYAAPAVRYPNHTTICYVQTLTMRISMQRTHAYTINYSAFAASRHSINKIRRQPKQKVNQQHFEHFVRSESDVIQSDNDLMNSVSQSYWFSRIPTLSMT